HWNDKTTPIEETFEAVAKLIEQGKIRYAGVCNYDVEQMKKAQTSCNIISNQIPFSMVNRDVEKEVIPYCIENHKSVLAYSPMERGLLTGKMKPGQQFKTGDHRATLPYFTDESIIKTNILLEKIKPIAEKHQATLAQIVLRWTIERAGITIALAGARNAEQSVSNAQAGSLKLTAEEYAFISAEVDKF